MVVVIAHLSNLLQSPNEMEVGKLAKMLKDAWYHELEVDELLAFLNWTRQWLDSGSVVPQNRNSKYPVRRGRILRGSAAQLLNPTRGEAGSHVVRLCGLGREGGGRVGKTFHQSAAKRLLLKRMCVSVCVCVCVLCLLFTLSGQRIVSVLWWPVGRQLPDHERRPSPG